MEAPIHARHVAIRKDQDLRAQYLRIDGVGLAEQSPNGPHSGQSEARTRSHATPYLGRTSTGWIAPALRWRTYSITLSARASSVGGTGKDAAVVPAEPVTAPACFSAAMCASS